MQEAKSDFAGIADASSPFPWFDFPPIRAVPSHQSKSHERTEEARSFLGSGTEPSCTVCSGRMMILWTSPLETTLPHQDPECMSRQEKDTPSFKEMQKTQESSSESTPKLHSPPPLWRKEIFPPFSSHRSNRDKNHSALSS